jgi:hypothetical protein
MPPAGDASSRPWTLCHLRPIRTWYVVVWKPPSSTTSISLSVVETVRTRGSGSRSRAFTINVFSTPGRRPLPQDAPSLFLGGEG